MKLINEKGLFVAVLFSLTCLFAQAQSTENTTKRGDTQKFIGLITGSWKLKSIVDAESKGKTQAKNSKSKDGTMATENPPAQSNNAMEIMEFSTDARYKMNTSTAAIDSGSYRINEQHGILYLESDRDNSPSEWKITIKDNVLTLGGRNKADKRYTYVYEKDESAYVKQNGNSGSN